ncbi:MAG: sigma-70 family RNA polymerase sigma factor [Candidatus Uhrbacteria bacterium]|nr:sigma-70 family RNA polymerase sigma factor [Candidatus Uhrbacteria bacterium]
MENESELLEQAKTDPLAFGQLYDFYYKPIFGFLYSRTTHVETAKDLTNETFFQALKNFHRFKPRKNASFKSWLFAIAVAQVGNFYRRRSKMFEVTTEEAPELVDKDEYRPDIAFQMGQDAEVLKEQIHLLRETMKQLDQKQQTILSLRFFSHMSIPEISKVLSMKEGTVKSHIHRALKRLQGMMLETIETETITEGVSIKKYEHVFERTT